MTELIKFCSKNMPYWNHTSVEGYTLGECRATAPQEVAFTIASVIAINQECIKAGLNPDDFVPRYSPHLWAGNDFFETIAKLRAFRRVWAKIHRERFGCKNPKSLQTRFFVQTAGSALTAQQPLNNTIRAAFHTLAAVLGGANTLHTDAYDEVYCVPTEEAATLALRTQQIIQHETNATKVGDPLAGSYYVEWLTSKIEEEAYKLIAQVDRIGYIKAWESGWFRGELTQRAFEWRKQVENGEETIVGVNKYVTGEELKIPVFKIEPSTEETAIERVKKFRDERDNTKVKEALNSLRQTAKKVNEEWPEGGDLMPSVIEAARANATLGEMTDVLREVFGWGYAF
jgi:methylmalonyl-CoA mutase N-terminal domain/subunit